MKLINKTYQLSLYMNLVSHSKPVKTIDINQLIEIVKYGYIKEVIEKLRGVDNEDKYKNIKVFEILNVTVSGIFNERNKSGLQKYSGLMQIDIDKLGDSFDATFQQLISDPYTYVCFRSPGGKGIKVIVKILNSKETHTEQFHALEKYYKENFDISIDTLCKDLSRAMLLSYDPELFCNPFSRVFTETFIPVNEIENNKTFTPTQQNNFNPTTSNTAIDRIIQAIDESGTDITEDYTDWVRVGYALCSEFGENGRGYFHQISRYYPKYTWEECNSKYTTLLQLNDGRVKMGTLVHLAKSKGLEIFNKQAPISPAIPQTQVQKSELYKKLDDARYKLHRELRIPAYLIFTNKNLENIETQKPKTLEELKNVIGVKKEQAEQFADYFLPIIIEHVKTLES